MDDFRQLPDRALTLSPEESALRYNSFETQRRHLLSLVVSQESKSLAKKKREVTPKYDLYCAMRRRIISHHIISHHILLWHITSYYGTSHHLNHIISYYIISHHITSYNFFVIIILIEPNTHDDT